MAEITAQKTAEELYNQLSPSEKQQYDGVLGMGGFKEKYEKNPTSQFVLGDVNYEKFKAIADAQAAAPKKSLLDSINIFSSASAAEPDKISSGSNTSGFQTIARPDGTIEIVPVDTSSNLPFSPITTFDAANQFSILPGSSTLPLDAFKNTVAPRGVNTGITASSAAIPFGTPIDRAQGFVKGSPSDASFLSSPLIIDPEGNYYMLDSNLDNQKKEKTGITKLFEFLQKFSPSGLAKRGLDALGSALDFSDSPNYRPATVGVFGYTPEELNKMNALGGFYSEPMREMRRRSNRISNIMRRAAEGKSYSQKNLNNLMNQFNMGNVDTGAMIQSMKESADMGYGQGGGGIFDSGRDYSSSPGAIAGDMEYGEE